MFVVLVSGPAKSVLMCRWLLWLLLTLGRASAVCKALLYVDLTVRSANVRRAAQIMGV
jgi:hypothetical protein